MEQQIVEYIQENKEALIKQWMKKVDSYREEQRLQHMTDEIYESTNRKFVELMIQSTVLNDQHKNQRIEEFAGEQIKLGWPLQYLTKGLQSFKKVLLNALQDEGDRLPSQINIYNEIDGWIDFLVDQLIHYYAGNWEKSDELHKLAIRELTAPVIPIVKGISVMPLVGTIDTERAKLIMENLLDGVIKYESEVVLIDITGVPIVDTMVAHHLIQASDAVRLVGAETILVGIRPEIAQTIVNLGIELGKFKTKSSLLKGVHLALEMTGRKIVQLEEGDKRE